MTDNQLVQKNREEISDKTLDILRMGIAGGVGYALSDLFIDFTLLPKSIEFGIGWLLGLLICYWLPKKIRPNMRFTRWAIISFIISILAFILSLIIPSNI